MKQFWRALSALMLVTMAMNLFFGRVDMAVMYAVLAVFCKLGELVDYLRGAE